MSVLNVKLLTSDTELYRKGRINALVFKALIILLLPVGFSHLLQFELLGLGWLADGGVEFSLTSDDLLFLHLDLLTTLDHTDLHLFLLDPLLCLSSLGTCTVSNSVTYSVTVSHTVLWPQCLEHIIMHTLSNILHHIRSTRDVLYFVLLLISIHYYYYATFIFQ